MKKNMVNLFKIALLVALQAVGFNSHVLGMHLESADGKDAKKVESFESKDVIFKLDKSQAWTIGAHTATESVTPETPIRNARGFSRLQDGFGYARSGRLVVIEENSALSVPLERLLDYLTVEYQPNQLAYLVTQPVDGDGNTMLHTILKVWLGLSHHMQNLVGLDAKHAEAIVSASEATEASLDYALTLPDVKDLKTLQQGYNAPLINAQNKAQFALVHLCIMRLNTNALAKVVAAGADINLETGSYKNPLHFLVVFLHDGEALKTLFGAVNDDVISAVKAMIKALVYDHKLPVLPIVRATFAHPDYAKGKKGKELEMLQNLSMYIYEPLIPEIRKGLQSVTTQEGLYLLIAEYASA